MSGYNAWLPFVGPALAFATGFAVSHINGKLGRRAEIGREIRLAVGDYIAASYEVAWAYKNVLTNTSLEREKARLEFKKVFDRLRIIAGDDILPALDMHAASFRKFYLRIENAGSRSGPPLTNSEVEKLVESYDEAYGAFLKILRKYIKLHTSLWPRSRTNLALKPLERPK